MGTGRPAGVDFLPAQNDTVSSRKHLLESALAAPRLAFSLVRYVKLGHLSRSGVSGRL